MPRNSSGVYTLPSAAFSPGTTISSSAVNANFSDIASALTGSLPVNGTAAMSGPLMIAAGSVTSPGLSFASDTNTGIYYLGTGSFGITLDGVLAVTFNANLSTLWAGAQTIAGNQTVSGNSSVTGTQTIGGAVTLTTPNISLDTSKLALAQCRLTLSGGNLLLSPYKGNMLYINGQNYVIPSAGITLGNGTTALSTLYYIYAYMNSGTMTLEASTTVKETNTTTGWTQKTGDATRTLVGLAYTTTGNVWADTDGNRLTLSYFNRIIKKSSVVLAGITNTSSATPVEITTMRNNFICWADDNVKITSQGWAYSASANAGYNVAICISNTTALSTFAAYRETATTYSTFNPSYNTMSLTEGALNYATLTITSNGTITVSFTSTGGGFTAAQSTTLTVEIVG